MNDFNSITVDSYRKNSAEWIKTHQNNMVEKDQKDFMQLLDSINGRRILDAGCGFGLHSLLFSNSGYDVVGIDAVEPFIIEAKKRAPHPNFQVMDLRRMTFPNNKFDGVWACASLLHFRQPDLSKILDDFYRILTDKGILYTSVKEGEGERIEKDRLFVYHSNESITYALQKAGFTTLLSTPEEKDNGNWITTYSFTKKPSAL